MRRGGRLVLAGSALVAGLVALLPDATAGTVAVVVEADTVAELAIAVSQHVFADGSVADVVVADPSDQDALFEAAAFTASTPLGAPLLLTGGSAPALLAEAARVTGGPGGADGSAAPTIWLYGVDDPGFASAGYADIRDVDRGNLLEVFPGGNEGRILLAEPGSLAAGAAAAGYATTWGIPLVVGATFAPPEGGFATTVTEALVVGDVAVADGAFAVVQRFTADGASALAAEVGEVLAAEQADGMPFPRVVRPVAADGLGSEPAPAALAAVVAAGVHSDGSIAPLALVDGRPATDPAAACSAGSDRDAAASCLITAAEGDTVLVTLRSTARPAEPAAPAPRSPASLPATGPTGSPGDLALVAVAIVLFVANRARRHP